jgi:hypothetical protein
VSRAVEIRILGLLVRFSALEAQKRSLIFFKIDDELSRELRNLKLQYSSSILQFNIQLQVYKLNVRESVHRDTTMKITNKMHCID